MSSDPTPQNPKIETDPITGEIYELYKKNGCWVRDYRKWDKENKLIKRNGPDIVYLDNNRIALKEERWVNNSGMLHREDGPARIVYGEENQKEAPIYIQWQKNGYVHRENGPAVIWFIPRPEDGNWYKNGKKYEPSNSERKIFRKISVPFYKKHEFLDRESVLRFDHMVSVIFSAFYTMNKFLEGMGISPVDIFLTGN